MTCDCANYTFHLQELLSHEAPGRHPITAPSWNSVSFLEQPILSQMCIPPSGLCQKAIWCKTAKSKHAEVPAVIKEQLSYSFTNVFKDRQQGWGLDFIPAKIT